MASPTLSNELEGLRLGAIPKSSSYNLRPGQTELDYTNMLDIDQDNTFTTSLQVSLKIFILSFFQFEVSGAVATEKLSPIKLISN